MYKNISGINNINRENQQKKYYLENIYSIDYKDEIIKEGYKLDYITSVSMDWYYMNIYEIVGVKSAKNKKVS